MTSSSGSRTEQAEQAEQTELAGSHGGHTAHSGTPTLPDPQAESRAPQSEEPHTTQPRSPSQPRSQPTTHPTTHPNPTPTSPRVIFMCAPPGSGKSTYAHRLASSGYTRLSIDDTAWAQGHRIQPLPDDVGASIVAELDARLLSLVRGGRDVVLDYSFWARAIRDKYRRLLAKEGVVPRIVYVRTPKEVGVERMRRRRGQHGDDFWLDNDTVGRYWDAFEVPTDEEGEVVVVDGCGGEQA